MVCNQCKKAGHIKQCCRVNLKEAKAIMARENGEFEQPRWEQCLSIEVID